jgi:hypothetical protein
VSSPEHWQALLTLLTPYKGEPVNSPEKVNIPSGLLTPLADVVSGR